MKIIGITGPSGSGKTTLTDLLSKKYNSYTIYADKVARKLTKDTSSEYFKKILKLFGNEILLEDGSLNRKKIATLIYKSDEKRNELNKLTFQYVVKEIIKEIEENKVKNFDYIGIDVPLLYEAKMESLCDYVIAVIAEDEEKILRICKRDNITPEMAMKRLEIQNNNEFFIKNSDFIIYNNGSLKKLENSLKEIIEKI